MTSSPRRPSSPRGGGAVVVAASLASDHGGTHASGLVPAHGRSGRCAEALGRGGAGPSAGGGSTAVRRHRAVHRPVRARRRGGAASGVGRDRRRPAVPQRRAARAARHARHAPLAAARAGRHDGSCARRRARTRGRAAAGLRAGVRSGEHRRRHGESGAARGRGERRGGAVPRGLGTVARAAVAAAAVVLVRVHLHPGAAANVGSTDPGGGRCAVDGWGAGASAVVRDARRAGAPRSRGAAGAAGGAERAVVGAAAATPGLVDMAPSRRERRVRLGRVVQAAPAVFVGRERPARLRGVLQAASTVLGRRRGRLDRQTKRTQFAPAPVSACCSSSRRSPSTA